MPGYGSKTSKTSEISLNTSFALS